MLLSPSHFRYFRGQWEHWNMWKEAEKYNLFRGEPIQITPNFGNFDILPRAFQLLTGIVNWIALKSQDTPLCNTFSSQNKYFIKYLAMQDSFHVRFLWTAPSSGCTVPNTTVLWEHRNFTNCPSRVIWNWAHLLKYSKSSLDCTYSGISPESLFRIMKEITDGSSLITLF